MAYERTLQEPICLSDPLEWGPKPAPGCDVCGALASQYATFNNPSNPEYNPSKATDVLVEIGRHPHGEGRS
ncbi:hypothetical protein SAM23877_6183 [Streptomyces ambofaciens ATCC 23877]|uniref:Uncharacterized protein n=1 Tax=Streptomyces ambofaciens (strain ATCC 23877 / 3486 / DSM 40053 / JCM 4204 / NBRC 12836 / NRRL B-2516) TaxID=278992 RepID=A0A0K2B1Z6_STRA7|nr:hypothetical protein SAM23877_6183 [Streptomyces ambofaciens ATCC 23877]WNA15423.1 hypothetical protein SAMYPH_92 [Streptomyces phage Samy]